MSLTNFKWFWDFLKMHLTIKYGIKIYFSNDYLTGIKVKETN